MDIEDARALFPVTRELTYLDNASISAIPTPVVEAVTKSLQANSSRGSMERATSLETVIACRQRIANFLGCTTGEVAFARNTVEGLSWVARGIRWREGDNVVIPDVEFLGNVVPWWNLRPFGVELRRVSARDGRILVGDIVAATDERTRLVSISLVQFLNGFRIDLEELGNECRKRGVLLCVDAIQALGTMPFDVRSLPIDFLASGAHKWLLSPVGAAFFYCRNESLEHLHVTEAGHHSVAATEGKWIQDEIELLPDAQRFEGGVPSFPVVAGMETALGLLLQIGLPAIAARIRTLTDQLIAGLRRQDYHIVTPLHEQERSAIVAFSPHPYDADVLRSKLQEAGIIVASRSGLIRVSPHFYNNPEDIGRLLANLPRLR